MIVLKHNGIVYIAVSQAYQKDMDAIRTGKVNPENIKAYHPQNRKNQLIATDCVTCVTEALRYIKIFPKTLNSKTLVLDVFPLLTQMTEFYSMEQKGYSSNLFVFAKDSEAYAVYKDGTCLEIEDVFVNTDSSEIGIGVYDAKNIENPIEFFRSAFATHEELCGEIMFPVAVLSTKDNKIKVINREK